MKNIVASVVLCGASLSALADPQLPHDVSRFIERRESCDHWRSERGYDGERQAEIDWAVCQSCPGTDSELAHLKEQYQGQAAVQEKLAQYEPNVEPANKAKAKKFCQSTKRPK